MTQSATLLAAFTHPASQFPKSDSDSQNDESGEFSQFWMAGAETTPAHETLPFTQEDVPVDAVPPALAGDEIPLPEAVLLKENTKTSAENVTVKVPPASQALAEFGTIQSAPIRPEPSATRNRPGGTNPTGVDASAPVPDVPVVRQSTGQATAVDAASRQRASERPLRHGDTPQQTRKLDQVAANIGPQNKGSPPNHMSPAALPQSAPQTPVTTSTPMLPPNTILGIEPSEPDLHAATVPQSTTAFATSTPTAPNNAYARQVVQQITTAILQTTGATTEIALNPEELGRVRISLTTAESGLTVAILTERPETADLMRRNLEHLARELRDMGYDNPTFTFGDQSGAQDEDASDGQAHPAPDPTQIAEDLLQNSLRVALSGGLDLKL